MTYRDYVIAQIKHEETDYIPYELRLAGGVPEKLTEFLKRFDENPYPVVLSIPTAGGSTGYGVQVLKSAMERALGVDILFHEN